jgi:flagellar motor switch/type III secretory pathway protein FliN
MTRVEPLSVATLPKAASPRKIRARVPWTWVGEPGRMTTLVLPGMGMIHLSWQGLECTEVPSSEEFMLLDGDGRAGRLVVDRWLALSVVAATLGLPPPAVLRRLGPVERGVLAGYLAAALADWGGRITVALFDPRRALDAGRLVGLTLRVEALGASGLVKLDVPAGWLTLGRPPDAQPDAFRAVVECLPVVACIELAVTGLRLAELAAARIGDAVVFDGRAAPSIPEWTVDLRIGDYSAAAVATADGAVVFEGPFQATRAHGAPPVTPATGQRVLRGDANAMTTKSESDGLRTEVLAAAPVEVIAELGRITLRGDEVLGLERGTVLRLGDQGRRIDLVVGGRPWARGELVNVDGELGVRIVELVRG